MGQNEAGYVTSAIQSPLWDAVIALGYVRRGANDIGAKLLVQTPGGNISAQIIDPWR
jgi:glycine cleavage system aminomethyltransferase T